MKPLENLIQEVQSDIVELMNSNGLNAISDFSIKIKDLPTGYLALYRGSSVFTSRAIFWVSPDFYLIAKEKIGYCTKEDEEKFIRLELWKTIIHEVGHSLADLLRLMARRTGEKKVKAWIGRDEEEFAEDFIWVLQTGQVKSQDYFPFYEKMIKELIS